MNHHTIVRGEEHAAQAANQSQTLLWAISLCFVSALVELAIGTVVTIPMLISIGLFTVLIGITLLLALRISQHGRLRQAALVIAVALDVSSIVIALIMPSTTAGVVIVPLLSIIVMLPYLSQRELIITGVIASASMVITHFLGTLVPPLLPQPERMVGVVISAVVIVAAAVLTVLLLWQFSSQLGAKIAEVGLANNELRQAHDTLEQKVAERTADLRSALADVERRANEQAQLLAENTAQREVIREMSVPVLPVNRNTIVIPLIGAMDSQRLIAVQEQALHAAEQARARFLLLDITGVPVVDTLVARGLLTIVQASKLLGAQVILVGVRPEVAQAVVTLGLDLSAVPTRQTLQDGLAYVRGQN